MYTSDIQRNERTSTILLSLYETVGDEKQQNRSCFIFRILLPIILLNLLLLFGFPFSFLLDSKYPLSGADPGFQVSGGALKKIAPSGGRSKNFGGISCEKSRFYAKKSYFFRLRREARKFLRYFV